MSEPNDKKQGQTFIEKKPKKDWNYRLSQLKTPKGIFVLTVIALGLLLLLFIYGEIRRPSNPEVKSTFCSNNEELVQKASSYISEKNYSDMSDIVTEIKNNDQRTYVEDINCLYILTTYYAYSNESDSARYYLDMLVGQVGDSGVPQYSYGLANTAIDTGSLITYVEGLEVQNDLIKNQPRVGDPRD